MKIIFTSLALLAFGLPSAYAESRCQRLGHDQRFMQELNLNSEQADKVKSIRKKYKPNQKTNRAEIERLMDELSKGIQSPQRDDGYKQSLKDQFAKIQALKQSMTQSKFEMALEIRDVLTDEQLKKFKALKREKYAYTGESDND